LIEFVSWSLSTTTGNHVVEDGEPCCLKREFDDGDSTRGDLMDSMQSVKALAGGENHGYAILHSYFPTSGRAP
jgi:hypothetical protein